MATVNIPIRVHATLNGAAPSMQTMEYANAQTFPLGAVLILSSGQVVVAATDPFANIVGVSAQGADTNPGFAMQNNPAVFTGRQQTVTVFRPNDNMVFAAQLVNGSDTIVAPATADIGGDYGFRLCAGGFWAVDKSLNDAVKVQGFVADLYGAGLVFFKFQLTALMEV